MVINRKADYWEKAPWYVKFSALGLKTTDSLEDWSVGCFGFAVILAVTTYLSQQPPFTAYAFFIGAYFYQKSATWLKNKEVEDVSIT